MCVFQTEVTVNKSNLILLHKVVRFIKWKVRGIIDFLSNNNENNLKYAYFDIQLGKCLGRKTGATVNSVITILRTS